MSLKKPFAPRMRPRPLPWVIFDRFSRGSGIRGKAPDVAKSAPERPKIKQKLILRYFSRARTFQDAPMHPIADFLSIFIGFRAPPNRKNLLFA